MKLRPITGEGFEDYYVNQIGHGMPVFTGAAMQRGHGLGNILRGLFKVAVPLIKTIGKSALKKSVPILKEVGKQAVKRSYDAVTEELTKPKQPRAAQFVGHALKQVAKQPRRRKPKPKNIDVLGP